MQLSRRALLAASLLAAGSARAACTLQPRATVPLRAIEGFPVLDAAINGIRVTFLLDTGAQAHLVLPAAQAALRLPQLPGAVPLIGTGGARAAPLVLLHGVTLGPVRLPPAPTPVAPLPAVPHVAPMLAGLLGAPLLENFDLDLDVAAGRLDLFQAGGCGGALPDLAARQTVINLAITPDGQALLPVAINGLTVVALLDTGSRATLLTAGAARRLGLSAPESANTARGVDGERVPVGHTRVQALAVGNDIRRNVPISISPLDLGPADMLLGFDYLRQRRVWFSLVNQLLVIALPSPAPSGR